MRIGICNGGGDAPALNAVLRAVVKTSINKYGYQVFGFRDGFRGMIERDYQELDLQYVSGLLPKGGTVLGTTNRDDPFNYHGRDASSEVAEICKELSLDALVVVGGEGTLGITYDLMDTYGIPVIGVPKTIDNDFADTDYTFGFQTAVETATHACDILHDTAESHHRVMILEVMGRTAGWIALHAGMAGGADIILIPEIPCNLQSIIHKIKERSSQGKRFSIIVAAEGVDSFDGQRHHSIGHYLTGLIEEATGMETRNTILGHLQRGGSPCANDRILGTQLGAYAVDLIHKREFNKVVVLQGTEIASIDLTSEMKLPRHVRSDSQLVGIARGIGISFGDEVHQKDSVE